ncbi:hypothetical protein K0T92_13390 [Paenibacillus oenotherae]|uniref:Uncharacterized protein n=1 Tax=Paenibacillus oenotherae TaxID=1435645 RepID=A0ABS7D726_9BACL|nr:hypothetical protein [Paenibacillus oenotherae]MBW7475742.1 hypothetical protein [Paenibacillus oenotherae]
MLMILYALDYLINTNNPDLFAIYDRLVMVSVDHIDGRSQDVRFLDLGCWLLSSQAPIEMPESLHRKYWFIRPIDGLGCEFEELAGNCRASVLLSELTVG